MSINPKLTSSLLFTLLQKFLEHLHQIVHAKHVVFIARSPLFGGRFEGMREINHLDCGPFFLVHTLQHQTVQHQLVLLAHLFVVAVVVVGRRMTPLDLVVVTGGLDYVLLGMVAGWRGAICVMAVGFAVRWAAGFGVVGFVVAQAAGVVDEQQRAGVETEFGLIVRPGLHFGENCEKFGDQLVVEADVGVEVDAKGWKKYRKFTLQHLTSTTHLLLAPRASTSCHTPAHTVSPCPN
jgi:hypothetical protein